MLGKLSLLGIMLTMSQPVAAQPLIPQGQRAPVGYETICWGWPISFEPGTSRIKDGDRDALEQHTRLLLSRHEWLRLVVRADELPRGRARDRLTRRRTEAILAVLASVGIDRRRVEINIQPAGSDHPVAEGEANIWGMISPREVDELRRAREERGIIVC